PRLLRAVRRRSGRDDREGRRAAPKGILLSYDSLPTVNAVLNGIAAILLLISYLTYHAHAKIIYFQGTGPIRTVYLTILATHTVLAAAVPVLAIITLSRGLSRKFDRHRAIAKWTWPIWMYVSITGVVVYLMLFHWPGPVNKI